MRTAFTALLLSLLAIGSISAQLDAKAKPVTVSIVSENNTIVPGSTFRVAVKLDHQPTFHSYGKKLPADGTGMTTVIKWKLPNGLTAKELPWPPTHETDSTGGTKVPGYDGVVYLPAEITASADLAKGTPVKLEAAVNGLVCDPGTCMPFSQDASLELKVGDAAVKDTEGTKAFKPFQASIISELSTVASSQTFRAAVRIQLDPEWHIYAKTLPAGATGKPTSVNWKVPDGWKVEELPWPDTTEFKSLEGKTVPGYGGTVILPVQITAPAGLATSGKVSLEATLGMLVCKDVCIPELSHALSLDLTLGQEVVRDIGAAKAIDNMNAKGSASGSTAPKEGLLTLLLFAFVGGLILNVMPCVFPVLGIKILGVVKQSGEDKRQIVLHGLAYTLGVLVSFWVLAGLIIAIKSAGGNVAWGFQLQSPAFVFSLVVFLFAFGMNMAGVFEVGSSAVGVGANLTHKSGLGGSFFSGLLATIVATPCAAPFLAPALAFALTLTAIPSLFFFTVIGLGLAAPYLVLSLFPKLVALMPRPGAWMESFKQAMSFLMFATVAYLLWTLAGMVDEDALFNVLIALVMVAIACWVYGRWSLPHKPKATRAKAWIFTLLFLGGGMALAWPGSGDKLKWEPWSPETVASLRDEKKPVYIDFTARWCATCQVNKRVYKDKDLREKFEKHGVVALKADWTNYDERITDALKALDRAAVPVNVLYVPGREEPTILPNLLTVANVSEALAELDKTPTAPGTAKTGSPQTASSDAATK